MDGKRGVLSDLRKSPRGSETFDSHLDRDYMIDLDHHPAVRDWTKEHGVTIPYRLLGIGHTYHPDFLVTYNDGSKRLRETQGPAASVLALDED